MKHLTVDEILDFVSLTELNSKSIELSAKVNGHIRECDRCLKLVRAFQMLYDEFSNLNSSGSFKNYLLKEKNDKMAEISVVIEELEDSL